MEEIKLDENYPEKILDRLNWWEENSKLPHKTFTAYIIKDENGSDQSFEELLNTYADRCEELERFLCNAAMKFNNNISTMSNWLYNDYVEYSSILFNQFPGIESFDYKLILELDEANLEDKFLVYLLVLTWHIHR